MTASMILFSQRICRLLSPSCRRQAACSSSLRKSAFPAGTAGKAAAVFYHYKESGWKTPPARAGAGTACRGEASGCPNSLFLMVSLWYTE